PRMPRPRKHHAEPRTGHGVNGGKPLIHWQAATGPLLPGGMRPGIRQWVGIAARNVPRSGFVHPAPEVLIAEGVGRIIDERRLEQHRRLRGYPAPTHRVFTKVTAD